MEKSLSYSDVYLVPRFSTLTSRSNTDISVSFLGRKWKAPWIPANMSSVINEDIAKWLSENDYFYIYHRFGNNYDFVKKTNEENWKTISISIGVKKEDFEFLDWCREKKYRIDFITIDIAHGHSILVREAIEHIKCKFDTKIIAGNICTQEAAWDLQGWGADAVKAGIAGGHACSTKNMTGFHVPMFSCIKNICSVRQIRLRVFENLDIPVVADGGIRENGDIPKSLVAGATMVMAGGLFAACADAPGENVYPKGYWREWISGDCITKNRVWVNGPLYKRYYGSASAKQKGNHTHVEGFEIEIPSNNLTYQEKYKELTESLQSAVSYAGGKDLSAFEDVKYLRV